MGGVIIRHDDQLITAILIEITLPKFYIRVFKRFVIHVVGTADVLQGGAVLPVLVYGRRLLVGMRRILKINDSLTEILHAQLIIMLKRSATFVLALMLGRDLMWRPNNRRIELIRFDAHHCFGSALSDLELCLIVEG